MARCRVFERMTSWSLEVNHQPNTGDIHSWWPHASSATPLPEGDKLWEIKLMFWVHWAVKIRITLQCLSLNSCFCRPGAGWTRRISRVDISGGRCFIELTGSCRCLGLFNTSGRMAPGSLSFSRLRLEILIRRSGKFWLVSLITWLLWFGDWTQCLWCPSPQSHVSVLTKWGF